MPVQKYLVISAERFHKTPKNVPSEFVIVTAPANGRARNAREGERRAVIGLWAGRGLLVCVGAF